ncbi:MAG: PIN domain-containing protein [Ferruginibacter sp.]|nr:PIN domain-containing protein [Ferruginibacter sp.]
MMKNIFLDTNIIIDFFADRKPFSTSAEVLFNYALNKKMKLYVSTVSYNNTYYILRQSLSHQQTIHLLNSLMDITEAVDVSKTILQNALKSEFKDFEDAIQYYCALSVNKMEVIVTRNTKDFRKSNLPVMTPDELLSSLQ